MDRMIYLSMSGAKATMQRQELISHNLANVSTVGFRAEMQAFRAVPVRGDGATTRAYALETTTGYNDQAGVIQTTGRALDVAMKGNAWLAVQGNDGTEAYTRNGQLDINAEGLLMTMNGLTVLGDGGPINVPQGQEVAIAADGTVSAKPPGTAGRPTPIGRLKLVTPEEKLTRGADGLFRGGDGELPADPNARVAEGALEGSNVSAVEAMVSMISASRQFEQQMKLIQTAERQERTAQKLLSANG